MVEKGKRGYTGALTDCVHDVRKQNTIAQVLLEVIDSSLVVRSRQVLVRPVRVNLEKIPVQQKRNKNKRGRLIGSNELRIRQSCCLIQVDERQKVVTTLKAFESHSIRF